MLCNVFFWKAYERMFSLSLTAQRCQPIVTKREEYNSILLLYPFIQNLDFFLRSLLSKSSNVRRHLFTYLMFFFTELKKRKCYDEFEKKTNIHFFYTLVAE